MGAKAFQWTESSIMPMRGIFPGCCARAASGHAAAAPPSSVMNSGLQNGAENAMSIRIGYLLPTRELSRTNMLCVLIHKLGKNI